MKHIRKTLFTFIIFMIILSITFNPFSAKAEPLMLNLPEFRFRKGYFICKKTLRN